MTTRRRTPALAAALLGALLLAAPALAAPNPDGGPWQLVAHWWEAITAPFASLLGAPAPGGGLSTVTEEGRAICDPNGLAAVSCVEEPLPGTTEARHTCDPDG